MKGGKDRTSGRKLGLYTLKQTISSPRYCCYGNIPSLVSEEVLSSCCPSCSRRYWQPRMPRGSLAAAACGVLPREVNFCCSVLSRTADLACNRQTVMGLSVAAVSLSCDPAFLKAAREVRLASFCGKCLVTCWALGSRSRNTLCRSSVLVICILTDI